MQEKIRLLIIDDEPIVGKRLKPALEKMGLAVEAVDNPREALRLFDCQPFDIVVTDVRMEGVDGIAILEHVTQNFPRTKVIMITGYAMMSTAREAMDKGAFDFIAKPFEPDELRVIVERAAAALGYDTQAPTSKGGND
ncbi:MAG: response regulator [Candidatus Abyssobacteria bacterium SURF_5]|jgi:DNA-binding NtrC family response regulator|uniref:Response regulator n=1 Tax=Abyssobacteria bacterium (strain SURF_5) TaxID=2093360 RepID=A0A3A4NGR4_ABYX5|nr:MAG: response regulator [Candidatus Abyssubacteria bacterium SURF_5]